MTVSGLKPKFFFFMGIYVVRELPFNSHSLLNPKMLLRSYKFISVSRCHLLAMQIHHTFVQLISVLISQCVMWMTANVSFMHMFPNGVRQLFKSKVRRTSYIALKSKSRNCRLRSDVRYRYESAFSFTVSASHRRCLIAAIMLGVI